MVSQFLATEVDVDGDGLVSENEFRTLACMLSPKGPPCNETIQLLLDECAPDTPQNTLLQRYQDHTHRVVITESRVPLHTVARLLNCTFLIDKLAEYIRDSYEGPEVTRDNQVGVAFEM